jgi:alpha-glucosidase (family GH31 glycosyl hydrolase)
VLLALTMLNVPFMLNAAPAVVTATDSGAVVKFETDNYVMNVTKAGFRYGFTKPDGTEIAAEHPASGLRIGENTVYPNSNPQPRDVATSVYNGLTDETASFTVTTTAGVTAIVNVVFYDRYVNMQIIPADPADLPTPPPAPSADTPSEYDGYLRLYDSATANALLGVLNIDYAALGEKYTYEADVRRAGGSGTVGITAQYYGTGEFLLFYINANAKAHLKYVAPQDTSRQIDFLETGSALSPSEFHHLKLEVDGTNVKAYVDGSPAYDVDVTNARKLTGGAGFRADSNVTAALDNIVVKGADGGVVFSEDFDSTEGIEYWSATKWKIMLSEANSKLTHVAGTGGAETDIPLTATAPPPAAYDGYIRVNDSNAANALVLKLDADYGAVGGQFTYEADIKRAGGDGTAGIYAMYSGAAEFLLFFIDKTYGYPRLKYISPATTGRETDFDGSRITPPALNGTDFFHFKMVVDGKNAKCYVGDTLVYDVDVAKAVDPAGGVGLRIDNALAAYDNLKLTKDGGETAVDIDFNDAGGADRWSETKWSVPLKDTNADGATYIKHVAGTGGAETAVPIAPAADPDPDVNGYLEIYDTPGGANVATTKLLNIPDLGDTYAFEAKLAKDGTGSAGIFAHYGGANPDSYILFFIDASNKIRLKFLNPDKTTPLEKDYAEQIQNDPGALTTGKEYALKLEVAGQNVMAYLDGVLVFDVTNENASDAQLSGGAGLRVDAGATAKYDDLTVTKSGQIVYSMDFDSEDGVQRWQADKWAQKGENGTTTLVLGGKRVTVPADVAADGEDAPPKLYTIDARLAGGIRPMYGLGDIGAASSGSNSGGGGVAARADVYGMSRAGLGSFSNEGGGIRFISNFSIAPARGFAQVLFEDDEKRVAINAEHTLLGVLQSENVLGLWYFFGAPDEIYRDYRQIRNEAGYHDTEPHYSMFGLGWEAFGAVGTQVQQTTVLNTVQRYLEDGYNITWAVIGSGFWPGARKASVEGTTTSFGMWDDTQDLSRPSDGLANPRFPDPDALKAWFKDKDIDLLLGLRYHLKVPTEYNGVTYPGSNWVEKLDGTFVHDLIDGGYYVKNRDGSFRQFTTHAAASDLLQVAFVDGANPGAVDWYYEMCKLWGVDGFKEDTMISASYNRLFIDGNGNYLLEPLITKDDNVMIMRNGAYALTGDILRINDANFSTTNAGWNNSPDRMLLNTFAYAASGASNVYPDIIGGTGGSMGNATFRRYIARNAQYAALTPSLSVGINFLTAGMETSYRTAAKDALTFHSTYAPYVYDAAYKSYETGYPYSHNPLHIAYYDDPVTHELPNGTDDTWEWMFGESLLAAPLFGTSFAETDTRDIYLPAGKWIEWDTGDVYESESGVWIRDKEMPYSGVPVFVGGKGVLVGEDQESKGDYFAEVYPIERQSVYDYTFIDGETRSTITNSVEGWSASTMVITDVTVEEAVEFEYDPRMGSFKFAYTPGHDYELTGGEPTGALQRISLASDKDTITTAGSARLTLTGKLDDGSDAPETAFDGVEIEYAVSPSGIVSVNADGVVTPLAEGKAEIRAKAAFAGGGTIHSNAVTIQVMEPFAYMDHPTNVLFHEYAGETTIAGTEAFTDYTVETELTFVSAPAADKTVGFNLGYQKDGQTYVVCYTQGKGWRILKRGVNANKTEFDINQTAHGSADTITVGREYQIVVTKSGGVLTLTVDGDQKLKVSELPDKSVSYEQNGQTYAVTKNADSSNTVPLAAGSVGVYVNGVDAEFGDIKIYRAIGEFPAELTGTSYAADKVSVAFGAYTYETTPEEDGTWALLAAALPSGTSIGAARALDSEGEVIAENAATIIVTVPAADSTRILAMEKTSGGVTMAYQLAQDIDGARAVIAVYSAEGRLIKTAAYATAPGGGTITLKTPLPTECSVKGFIWDEEFAPLTASFTLIDG